MASFDVIFIGGGPAGYVGAIRSAQLGLSVAVVEREGLGGTCVLWGCIPAKALLEAASMATKVGHAKDFGVNVGEVKLDYGVAMKRSRGVSTQNSKGVEFLFKKNKITWIKGTARISGKNSVSVKADGKDEKHEAKKAIVVSTGSRVKGLPQIGLELNKTTVLSSDEVLVLEKAPKTMAVIGAGAVGCEFADVFAAFGTQVTLIEALPGILPLEDADCSAELTKSFRKRKIDVVTGAKISDVKVGKSSVTMKVEAGGKKQNIEVETVLVANGRARTSGETEGFVKIIRDAKYGEILGAHIIGAHATEMIHELAVARENEYTVEEIDLAIHAHPTLSEAVAEAALDSLGKLIHA
jgi:dihydrolipoamide dehydrogenase